MAAVLYVVLLPHWQRGSRPESAVTRIEMVGRLLESVNATERPGFVRLCSDDKFRLHCDPAVPERGVPGEEGESLDRLPHGLRVRIELPEVSA